MSEEVTPAEQTALTKKRRTRRMLMAVSDVFEEHGLATSIDHIAKAAGVSSATFYNFFPSKAEYVKAAFLEEVVGPMTNYVPQLDTEHESLNHVVAGFFDKLGELCVKRPQLIRQVLIAVLETPTGKPGVLDPGHHITALVELLDSLITRNRDHDRVDELKSLVGSWSIINTALQCWATGLEMKPAVSNYLAGILQHGIRYEESQWQSRQRRAVDDREEDDQDVDVVKQLADTLYARMRPTKTDEDTAVMRINGQGAGPPAA